MPDAPAADPEPIIVSLRFRGSLNEFLKRSLRDTTVTVSLRAAASVKDVIESQGVPHPEVDLIVVNGQPVGFSSLVRHEDCIEVFPAGSADRPAGQETASLRPPPAPMFVLDAHLGVLARYLRMVGFDTWYRNDYDDPELAAIAGATRRILLTRDRGLLKRADVYYGYYVRATEPRAQVVEVLDRFGLRAATTPFGRCTRCNGVLRVVARSEVWDALPPRTRDEFDEFRRCVDCQRIYWAGSHFEAMRAFIETLATR